MSPRAAAMAPDDRRAALVDATLPLLREHGRAVSTRQIAQAAGVAEGTIFRVFDSKEELVEAALQRAFEPGRFVLDLRSIDRTLPLRDRLVELTTLLQRRFSDVFGLMAAVGMVAPPDDFEDDARTRWRARLDELLVDLVGEDADRLRMPADQMLHMLRLLTFSGSHPEISDHRLLSPEQIVDTVLYGTVHRPEGDST